MQDRWARDHGPNTRKDQAQVEDLRSGLPCEYYPEGDSQDSITIACIFKRINPGAAHPSRPHPPPLPVRILRPPTRRSRVGRASPPRLVLSGAAAAAQIRCGRLRHDVHRVTPSQRHHPPRHGSESALAPHQYSEKEIS